MIPPSPVAGRNPWASLDAADFSANLVDLLPPGDGWAGPIAASLLGGAGAAFGDLHAAAFQLSEVETIPSSTDVLLPDWEMDFGLPDCCTPLAPTVQQRRAALLAKIAAIGGQTAAYYILVARALGYTITITEGAPTSFSWTINAQRVGAITYFRAGQSRAGDLLESYPTNAQLECVMRQIMPAHTVLNFSYS